MRITHDNMQIYVSPGAAACQQAAEKELQYGKFQSVCLLRSASLWKCNQEAKTNAEPENGLVFVVSTEGIGARYRWK